MQLVDAAPPFGHIAPMLDLLSHQWRVWRYGAGVMLLLGVVAGASLFAAALLLAMAGMVRVEASWTLWLVVAALVMPFGLPAAARTIADRAREEAPPSGLDLIHLRAKRQKARITDR